MVLDEKGEEEVTVSDEEPTLYRGLVIFFICCLNYVR